MNHSYSNLTHRIWYAEWTNDADDETGEKKQRDEKSTLNAENAVGKQIN